MKAVRLQAYGDVDQFRFEDAPDPSPGAGEVLIRIAAISLNPVDMLVRQGWMKQRLPIPFPAILGVDVAGTVIAAGAGLTDPAPGDRVIGKLPINGRGSMAELVLARPEQLAKLPATLGFEAGATLPMAGLTGRQAVDVLGIEPGDRVLVTGALGSVGRAAVQYLKELGAVPVAGVRADRLDEARAFAGEALVIGQTLAAASFAGAVDTTGGPAAAAAVELVRDGGTLATVAAVATLPAGVNADGRITIRNVVNRDDGAMLQRIVAAADRGELTLPIARTFALSEAAGANRLLEDGHVGGKIVIAD